MKEKNDPQLFSSCLNTVSQFYKVLTICSILVILPINKHYPVVYANELEQTTIAIYPFKKQSSTDISQIQKAIPKLMASRLASKANVRIICLDLPSEGKLYSDLINNPQINHKLGNNITADYILTGSLTTIGTSLSIDSKIYNLKTGSEPQSFYASAKKEDEILSAIDDISLDIVTKIFDVPISTAPQKNMLTAYNSSLPQYAQPAQHEKQAASYPILKPHSIDDETLNFFKSQSLPIAIQDLDVGDIDGDGKDDIVIASKNKITAYHIKENQLLFLGEIEILSRFKIIALNLADIDRDNFAEVYVSSVDGITPNAIALEWNNGQFVTLFENEKRYIRPLNIPGMGIVLAGQNGGIETPFNPGIYQLHSNQDKVKKGDPLPIPDSVNIFEFSMADLDGNGNNEIITINEFDRLKVTRSDNRYLWQSEYRYGGNLRYVGSEIDNNLHSYGSSSDEEGNQERIYIPSRIIVRDLNNDGLPDIIANKNLSSASRIFKNFKKYPSGEIHSLSWTGIGMTEFWHTNKIDNYIASYQLVTPSNNRHQATLYVGIVLNTGLSETFSSDAESRVLIYHLDFKK